LSEDRLLGFSPVSYTKITSQNNQSSHVIGRDHIWAGNLPLVFDIVAEEIEGQVTCG
jgi:hypothetical protein